MYIEVPVFYLKILLLRVSLHEIGLQGDIKYENRFPNETFSCKGYDKWSKTYNLNNQ